MCHLHGTDMPSKKFLSSAVAPHKDCRAVAYYYVKQTPLFYGIYQAFVPNVQSIQSFHFLEKGEKRLKGHSANFNLFPEISS